MPGYISVAVNLDGWFAPHIVPNLLLQKNFFFVVFSRVAGKHHLPRKPPISAQSCGKIQAGLN